MPGLNAGKNLTERGEGAAMTEQALTQLARRTMLDAARLEYGGEEPHTFSLAFERRMKKLLRRGRQIGRAHV